MKARHTVLGYGTKVWFQIPAAAAACQTIPNTTTDSSGSAARVSRPRQRPDGDVDLDGESTCDSSGVTSTKTDTVPAKTDTVPATSCKRADADRGRQRQQVAAG